MFLLNWYVWQKHLISPGLPTLIEKNGDFVLWLPRLCKRTYSSSSESTLDVSLEGFEGRSRLMILLCSLLTVLPARSKVPKRSKPCAPPEQNAGHRDKVSSLQGAPWWGHMTSGLRKFPVWVGGQVQRRIQSQNKMVNDTGTQAQQVKCAEASSMENGQDGDADRRRGEGPAPLCWPGLPPGTAPQPSLALPVRTHK